MEEHLFCNGKLKIVRIETENFNSNTYIIDYKGYLIVIDPGENKCDLVFSWLKKENKIPSFCLITHEHFDHNIGYKKLSSKYNFKTFCSIDTMIAMSNSKKNLSYYYNIDFKTELINYSETLPEFITPIKTPGHTKGSLCYLIENCLFSGDTIVKKEFMVSKLPGGNKEELKISVEKIKKLSKKIKNLIIFPGHGKIFSFNEKLVV